MGHLRILFNVSFAVLAVAALAVLTTNRAQAGVTARTAVSSCKPAAHRVFCNGTVTLRLRGKTTRYFPVQCFVSSATEEVWRAAEFLLQMTVIGHGRKGQAALFTFRVAGKQVIVNATTAKVTLASNRLTGSFSGRTTAGNTVSGSFACK